MGFYFPSPAQHAFREIVIEPDVNKCRSHTKYPDDPRILCELENPNPATIIREATLTFPSGVSLTMCDSTIKSLILTVVLYEEFDFGTDK